MTQQLVKKGANGRIEHVNPRSWIEAIKDKNTGQTLVEILQGFNMYFLPYNGNTSSTRCLVPTMLRKKGLWITYVKYDGNVYTEWYAADEIDDKSWGDSSNWRIGNNTLVGDITISANGNWVINGTETEFKAVGEKGNTPLLRVANNRLQVSYDLGDTYIDVTNNPVYTKFRWLATSGDTQANNVGRIQASVDEGKTWTNMSNDFTNNLHIKKYIGVNESLPTSGIAEGTIYAKGPYYAEDDTLNDNPIYRLWVYAWKGNTLAWQDNGEFTGITAGVVQEMGDSETEVMSQKAVSKKLAELGSKFFNYRGYALRENGSVTISVDEVASTDYIPLLKGVPIRIIGGWRNPDSEITPYAFFSEDKTFISSYTGEKATNNIYEVIDIPDSAVYIRICSAFNLSGIEPYIEYITISDIVYNYANENQVKDYTNYTSGRVRIDYRKLVDIENDAFFSYSDSSNFDAGIVQINDASNKIKIINGYYSAICWFSTNEIKSDSYIGITTALTEWIDVPKNAKLAVIRLNRAQNIYGYKNMIVLQDGNGCSRNEISIENLYEQGLINVIKYEELSCEVVSGYHRTDGTILESSDFYHSIYNISSKEYYHLYYSLISNSSSFTPIIYKNNDLIVGFDKGVASADNFIIDSIIKPFSNANKIVINWSKKNGGAPSLKRVDVKLKNVSNEIESVSRHLAKYDKGDIIEGTEYAGFIKKDGTFSTLSSMHYVEYIIPEGVKTIINSNFTLPSTGYNVVNWVAKDEYDSIIDHSGEIIGPVSIIDQLIELPERTKKLYVNNIGTARISAYTAVKQYIQSEQLENEIKNIKVQVRTPQNKVHINSMNPSNGDIVFYIRAKYNKTKDIIISYQVNDNGILSPWQTYIGNNELSDVQLQTSTYLISSHTDSTAPLFNSSVYWHLFAQHGYVVPYIDNNIGMTSDNVGSIWKDQLDREYTIGQVTEDRIILLPTIYKDSKGNDTRDWKTPNDASIVSLLHVNGGVYTSEITVSHVSHIQLRPIMNHSNRVFMIDGTEVKEAGTYYFDEFKVSESQVGYDPASIKTWFPLPELDEAKEMARFTWSYNFKGAQCCVNTTIDIRTRVECQSYGATQQQTFFDNGDYKAMFVIPKATSRNGIELDKPFNSPSSDSPSYYFARTSAYLKDVDNPIDRLIAFLHNPTNNTYLAGMAAGLSLVSGDTITEKRIKNIPIGDKNPHYRVGSFSPSNKNKFYIAAVNTAPFENDNYHFPTTYFKEINYYVSYFDPSDNEGQVYWYKDGGRYVIYMHCQTEQNKLAVNLPDFMEGLRVEVVEKTEGATLLTDVIQNGKLYVNYNEDANHIVVKTI